jgi:enterochelin esterase-like enzyme
MSFTCDTKHQNQQLSMLTRFFMILFMVGLSCGCISAQLTGQLESYPNFESRFVSNHRIDVWIPANYSSETKYSVLYCQDGQNLFDTLTNRWHQEWCMDETASQLIAEGKTEPFIVVGIWNAGNLRHAEYFPEKAINDMPALFQDSLQTLIRVLHPKADLDTLLADEYLKFIVTEVKPFVDEHYSTKSDKNHTCILGSSSGGLLAMYAICEYPQVFGGAACLSTHFTGIFRSQNNPFPAGVLKYFEANHPNRKHKLYFDTGNMGLDSLYTPHFIELQRICSKEYGETDLVLTRTFDGATHNETAWRERLDVPLVFLFGTSYKMSRRK